MKYFVEGVTRAGLGEARVDRIGEYDDIESAVVAARLSIDVFLRREFKDGMSAGALFIRYQSAGQVPFIFNDSAATINVPGFNHFEYAMRRCEQLCVQMQTIERRPTSSM